MWQWMYQPVNYSQLNYFDLIALNDAAVLSQNSKCPLNKKTRLFLQAMWIKQYEDYFSWRKMYSENIKSLNSANESLTYKETK